MIISKRTRLRYIVFDQFFFALAIAVSPKMRRNVQKIKIHCGVEVMVY